MADTEYRTLLIKEMPEGERPRERLEAYGEGALSNAELIAICLRTGSPNENAVGLAQRLLATFGGLAGLSRASVREMCQVPGIGPAKASQLKASIELGRRLIATTDDARPQIRCPDDAARLLIPIMGAEPQEELRVLLLDTRHRVIRQHKVYVGNVNTSIVRMGEVFREAVRDNALAIIVAHNHPSGDTTPSVEDIRITEEIVEAGKRLDIELLDHLIIGRHGYYSLKEHGQGF